MVNKFLKRLLPGFNKIVVTARAVGLGSNHSTDNTEQELTEGIIKIAVPAHFVQEFTVQTLYK